MTRLNIVILVMHNSHVYIYTYFCIIVKIRKINFKVYYQIAALLKCVLVAPLTLPIVGINVCIVKFNYYAHLF